MESKSGKHEESYFSLINNTFNNRFFPQRKYNHLGKQRSCCHISPKYIFSASWQ